MGVRTRRRSYRCQNQEEALYVLEPGGGAVNVITRRSYRFRTRRRSFRCKNQEEGL